MKISGRCEDWEVDPLNFLTGFDFPGNSVHQLWATLCRLSLQVCQQPLRVSFSELEAESGLDAREVQQILEASVRHGNARLIIPKGDNK